MFATKADLFDADLARMAEQLKALSHPARLAILRLLAERQTCICGDLVDELPLAQASVSRHLKTLKEAGLIRGEIDGPRSCYCLDRPALERLAGATGGFLAEMLSARPADTCC